MNPQINDPSIPIENLAIGSIIEVDGQHVIAELDPNINELSRIYAGHLYPIGQFGSILKIHFGRRMIYGYVCRLRMKSEYEREKGIVITDNSTARVVEADLFGEGEWTLNTDNGSEKWELAFDRGVSTFPLPRQVVYLTPKNELEFIYGKGKGSTILIGEHVGSTGTPCYADMNEMLGKHTAILGSTGSGKSAAVAAIIHSIIEKGKINKYEKWNPRIVILDPHNEYSKAFEKHERFSTDEGSLKLPYWLLNLQESLSLFIGKTEFTATSQSNIIKYALLSARKHACQKLNIDPLKITVDSPIPYEFNKLIEAIDTQRPPGKNKQEQSPYDSIQNKIEILKNDSRMAFLMDNWDGENDPFPVIASQFFGGDKIIKIVDLSGVPNEVAGIASAAIARMLFSLKLWQKQEDREKSPILLVCEEAHRYVPNRGEALYEAAQEGIRRLAKEGRKYGIALMLVSQRPSEVEATVLSQCNSWIVLRITNDNDRQHVRSILPDSLAGLTGVLSGLRRREAIFVGQATLLPTRILITYLSKDKRPHSDDIDFDKGWQLDAIDEKEVKKIGERWRLQNRSSEN